MPLNSQERLLNRVVQSAETALADHSFVSAIDVLCGMGLLAHTQVEAWRKGQVDFLERVIQGNLHKISSSMAMFRRWAKEKGLKPSETRYVQRTRTGVVALQFSKSGDPEIEKNYRTHFVSPALSEQKQKRLQEKLEQAPQTVVFQILRDSQCSECGAEIERDSFLVMEAKQPLCLPCAGFGELDFLPSGDTALTRRATKHSGRMAVVVASAGHGSNTRGRAFWLNDPRWRRPRRNVHRMPMSEQPPGRAGPNVGAKKTAFSLSALSTRSGYYFRAARLVKRQPSLNTPRSGEAAASAGQRPAESSKSKP
jgi:hypothetical protein